MKFQDVLAWGSHLDAALFSLVNHQLYQSWAADLTYIFARDQVILIYLMAAALVYWWWRGWRPMLTMLLLNTGAVALTHLLHNQMLKPFFNRPRPFMSLDQVHVLAPLKDLSMVSLSFPSTHAASSAALAMVLIKYDSACRWPAIGFALIIGFFTIYSGGHYPLDVAAGYVIGSLVGWGVTGIAGAFGSYGIMHHPGHRAGR